MSACACCMRVCVYVFVFVFVCVCCCILIEYPFFAPSVYMTGCVPVVSTRTRTHTQNTHTHTHTKHTHTHRAPRQRTDIDFLVKEVRYRMYASEIFVICFQTMRRACVTCVRACLCVCMCMYVCECECVCVLNLISFGIPMRKDDGTNAKRVLTEPKVCFTMSTTLLCVRRALCLSLPSRQLDLH